MTIDAGLTEVSGTLEVRSPIIAKATEGKTVIAEVSFQEANDAASEAVDFARA